MKPALIKILVLAATVVAAKADPFSYDTRDLLLVFRKTGKSDMEVNLGSVSIYKNLSPGSTIDVGANYDSTTQLQANFGDFNGLSYAVIGTQRGAGAGVANTSYFTLKRVDPNTQTTAPNGFTFSKSASIQSAISGIAGDGSVSGAEIYANSHPEDSILNHDPVVIIPTSGADAVNSFTSKYTASGGLGSLAPSPGIENTTPLDFSTTGSFVTSDLYEYLPGTSSSPANYLGNFSLNNTGGITFTAVPEPNMMVAALLGFGLFALIGSFRRN